MTASYQPKAYILCRFARESPNYTSWMDGLSVECEVVDEYLPEWNLPVDAGIVITHMHYRWEEISTLRRLVEDNRIPVLILCDGILEFRNTWQHPSLADGSIFQPAMGHKLACIGRGQARILESWGNVGRCEVVGLPRLDELLGLPQTPLRDQSEFHLLVTTATTPAFDEQQSKVITESLLCLQNVLNQFQNQSSDSIQVTWRINEEMANALGMEFESQRTPLRQAIDDADAVITTPSTIYLESVLRGRPTAVLDFHNSPPYVPSAWTISASDQIEGTISELMNPPANKMLFQSHTLHEQLECRTAARPRMIELIETMIQMGAAAKQENRELRFDHKILSDEQQEFAQVNEMRLEELFPDQAAFQQLDLRRLQIELAAAKQRLQQLPAELAEKNRYIAQLNQAADRSRVRIEEMHNRIIALRKRFGVKPSRPPVQGRDVLKDEQETGDEQTN